jgi:putative ABC transport system permease protein
LESVLKDLRYGLKTLARNPGFTAAALLALTLGIGANSAIFSVVNGILIRPLPYGGPERLVALSEISAGNDVEVVAPANFLDWKEQNTFFEDLAAFCTVKAVLTGLEQPLLVHGLSVTPNLFAVLGVEPEVGRTFPAGAGRAGEERAVILSHGFWRRQFGADPQVVDRTLILDGFSHVVHGVMPPEFRIYRRDIDVYIRGPQGLPEPPFAAPPDIGTIRDGQYMTVFGRLKPRVSVAQAQAQMRVIATSLEKQFPKTNEGWSVKVVPLRERLVGNIRPTLLILWGAVGFVLLIACANIANLLLARITVREREIAVRAALGAGRGRLIRQLLSESVLLSLLGGGLGLLLAAWGLKLLIALAPASIPRLDQVRVDGQALAFTLLLSLVTGTLISLLPALQASRPDLQGSLKEGGGKATSGSHRGRLFRLFVVTEVALALVLLVGAGLLMTSFVRLLAVDPGFDPANVLVMRISLPAGTTKYPSPPYVAAFNQQLTERLKSVPGIVAAGTTGDLPLSGVSSSVGFQVEGVPDPPPGQENTLDFHSVTPGYIRAMGIPLLAGRDFTDQDRDGSPFVVLINETLARRFWSGRNPIGHRLLIGGGQWVTIAGVVGDVRHSELGTAPKPDMLVSAYQLPSPSMWLVLRTSGDPMDILPAVKEQILAVDKDLPVDEVKPLEQQLFSSTAKQRFTSSLVAVLAAVALLLALVGIYSVMSFSVSQRTHELGVRMALGAQRRDVLWMVVGQGALFALIGVAVGLVAALGLTRTLSSLLFEVSATDPWVFTALSLALVLVALAASYFPARRAAAVDPVIALRQE